MIGRGNVEILKVIDAGLVQVQATLRIQRSRLARTDDYRLDPSRDEAMLTDHIMNHVYGGLLERLCRIQEMVGRESDGESPALLELDALISELSGILTGE